MRDLETIGNELIRKATVHGHQTAIIRSAGASAPLRYLLRRGWLRVDRGTVLDYGAGHGQDVKHLDDLGFHFATGYDPAHGTGGPMPRKGAVIGCMFDHLRFDNVLSTYVLNVLEDAHAINDMLARLQSHLNPGGRAIITVRADVKVATASQWNVKLDLPVIYQNGTMRIYLMECDRSSLRFIQSVKTVMKGN